MDGPPEGLSRPPDPPQRPRDLAVLTLAAGTGPPRQRARDQQADLAGGDLQRRLLDAVAALDPDPERLEETLAEIVAHLGEPTGPTRAVALQFLQQWRDAQQSPSFWAWMLGEALHDSDAALDPDRDRRPRTHRRGPA